MKEQEIREYLQSATPRQIGMDNTVETIKEYIKILLPEELQKERFVFPVHEDLYPYLDVKPTPDDFRKSVYRKEKLIACEDMATGCILYGALCIAEANQLLTYNLIPLTEYADRIGKQRMVVQQKLIRGNVQGAINFKKQWMIPENAEYEDYRMMKRVKKEVVRLDPKSQNKEKKILYYTSRTPRQIGYEAEKDQLETDLKELCPPRLQKRYNVFGGLKVALNMLDRVQTPDMYQTIIKTKNLTDITSEQLAIASAIHTALSVKEALIATFYNMEPITDFAERYQMDENAIRQKCVRGSIEGANRIGRLWYIPKTTNYSLRKKKRRKKNERILHDNQP